MTSSQVGFKLYPINNFLILLPHFLYKSLSPAPVGGALQTIS